MCVTPRDGNMLFVFWFIAPVCVAETNTIRTLYDDLVQFAFELLKLWNSSHLSNNANFRQVWKTEDKVEISIHQSYKLFERSYSYPIVLYLPLICMYFCIIETMQTIARKYAFWLNTVDTIWIYAILSESLYFFYIS